MDREYESLILLARVIFSAMGVSAISCGWLVLFLAPILFLPALLSVLTGFCMLMCAVRARRYMPREKFEREFR